MATVPKSTAANASRRATSETRLALKTGRRWHEVPEAVWENDFISHAVVPVPQAEGIDGAVRANVDQPNANQHLQVTAGRELGSAGSASGDQGRRERIEGANPQSTPGSLTSNPRPFGTSTSAR